MSSYNASSDPARGAPLPTPTSTQQPASAWASSTLSALDSEAVTIAKQEPHNYTDIPASGFGTTSMSQSTSRSTEGHMSTATTPGYEVPGAFPRHAQTNVVPAGDGATMGERASGMMDAAKEYVPAQKDVMKALESAGQMVGGYIPASVENYLPESVKAYFPNNGTQENRSLPSQETSANVHPSSRGGVGVLPGGPSETSVAKLPEERLQEKTDLARNSNLTGHFGDGPHNGTQESRSLPSQETSMNEHPSSRGGVGVLPGGRNEISVTKLPEERFQEGTDYGTEDGLHLNPVQYASGGPNSGATAGLNSIAAERSGVRNTDNRSNADPKVVGTDLFAGAKNSQSQWNSSSQATSGTPSAGGSTRSLYGSSVGPKTDDELDKPAKTEQPTSANQQLNTQARTHPLAHDGAKWKNVPLAEGYQKKLDEHEEMNVGDRNKRNPTEPRSSTNNAGKQPGMETFDSDRATAGHSGTTGGTPGVGNAGNTISSASGRPTGQEVPESDSTTSDSSGSALKKGPSPAGSKTSDTTKKPGFMDKIKGEVKVLSGKLGHKDEKVEEGRRLLGKN